MSKKLLEKLEEDKLLSELYYFLFNNEMSFDKFKVIINNHIKARKKTGEQLMNLYDKHSSSNSQFRANLLDFEEMAKEL